jgi:cytochrome c oxidase assembly factor CtaG
MVDPVAALVVVIATVAYASGVGRLRRRGRRWRTGRTVAFGSGLLAALVATQGWVASHDLDRFSAHMVQHVLLGMVVPLLIALGAPVTLVLQSARPATRSMVRRAVHSRLLAALSQPAIAWVLFGATPFALYLSPVFEVSLRNDLVHALVHVHFVLVGTLFFWPLVGIDPMRRRLAHGARLGLVVFAVPFHAFLGLALLGFDSPIGDGRWSLDDQRAGISILWASGELLGVTAGVIILWQWMAADERHAKRLDRELDAARN